LKLHYPRLACALITLSVFGLACGKEEKSNGISAAHSAQDAERDQEVQDLKALVAKLKNTHSSDTITISALMDRIKALEAVKAEEKQVTLEKLYAGKPGVDLKGLGEGQPMEITHGEYLQGEMVFPTLRGPEFTIRTRQPLVAKRKSDLPQIPDMNLYLDIGGRRAKIISTNEYQFVDDGSIFRIE
jgi:hypothetical protein